MDVSLRAGAIRALSFVHGEFDLLPKRMR